VQFPQALTALDDMRIHPSRPRSGPGLVVGSLVGGNRDGERVLGPGLL